MAALLSMLGSSGGLTSMLGGRATPSFLTKGINNEAQNIAGKVIGGIGSKAESGAKQIAHQKIDKLLPTFAEDSVKAFVDKGIHKAVSKGEQLATKEVSKIQLI